MTSRDVASNICSTLSTGHLPGVAIAIMGCIVNGPGEMADADFGYVGGRA
jgi:4-hydroxy-3-methylbut-2-en-1-yl diphosphate synthase IspG/GcpE